METLMELFIWLNQLVFCSPWLSFPCLSFEQGHLQPQIGSSSLFSKLSSQLVELGCTHSLADLSLFIYNHASVLIYFLVCLDDIVVIGSNPKAISITIVAFKALFLVKDSKSLSFFLGLEINPVTNGLHVS